MFRPLTPSSDILYISQLVYMLERLRELYRNLNNFTLKGISQLNVWTWAYLATWGFLLSQNAELDEISSSPLILYAGEGS